MEDSNKENTSVTCHIPKRACRANQLVQLFHDRNRQDCALLENARERDEEHHRESMALQGDIASGIAGLTQSVTALVKVNTTFIDAQRQNREEELERRAQEAERHADLLRALISQTQN